MYYIGTSKVRFDLKFTPRLFGFDFGSLQHYTAKLIVGDMTFQQHDASSTAQTAQRFQGEPIKPVIFIFFFV